MVDAGAKSARFARGVFAVAALLAFVAPAGWAFPGQNNQGSPPKAFKHDGRHEIERLEDKWRDAILKNDAVAMDALLSEDYVGIRQNGTLETKEQTLTRIRSGPTRLKSFQVVERKIRFYGSTALVTSMVVVETTGFDDERSGTFRYTRVYARDSRGAWKIVNFEATRLRSADGRPEAGGEKQ